MYAGLLKDGTTIEAISPSSETSTMTMGKISPNGSLPPHEMRTVLSRHHLTQLLYARIQSHHSDAIKARQLFV